jgi:hypothetical protein
VIDVTPLGTNLDDELGVATVKEVEPEKTDDDSKTGD